MLFKITQALTDISAMLLNSSAVYVKDELMKHQILKLITITLIALCATSLAARADCYVEYKAKKQSDGLKLHYGVLKLDTDTCESSGRKAAVEDRLAVHGWTLLRIIGTVRRSDLSTKKENAGDFFLRY